MKKCLDVLVVSDLHVGSKHAIMPPEVIIESDDEAIRQRIEQNPIQEVIWEKWLEATEQKYHACYNLGDSCEGTNPKSKGFDLWTTDVSQQSSTAADVLSMVKTRRYYGVQGSFYHVGENTSSDLAVIKTLQKRNHAVFGTDLVVNLLGHRMHLNHVIAPASSSVGKSTSSTAELASAAQYDKFFGKFDYCLRGHVHQIMNLSNINGRIAVCPCWKGRDSFQKKGGLRFGPPVLGWLVLHVTEDAIVVDDSNWFVLKPQLMFKEVEG